MRSLAVATMSKPWAPLCAPAPVAAPAAGISGGSSTRPPSRRPAEMAPHRIGRLARLPVFLDLRERRAMVAGGSAACAWKAELLAAAGAIVSVYAAAPGAEML